MPQRRFIIASALTRLIRRENGIFDRVVEGYFPARPDREHFVSIEPGHCYLVLAAASKGAGDEERTEVPRSQAEALMTMCAGKAGFECTTMRLRGGIDALLKHFVVPGPLDLLSVEFEEGADAEAFVPPAWLGPEVTQNAAYDGGSLARAGMPTSEEIPLSNAMLEELLDALEEGATAAQLGRVPPRRAPDAGPARGQTEAAYSEPDQPSLSPIESAQRHSQLEGLAHALEDFAPSRRTHINSPPRNPRHFGSRRAVPETAYLSHCPPEGETVTAVPDLWREYQAPQLLTPCSSPCAHDLHGPRAIGGGQDDLGSGDMLSPGVSVARNRLQALPVLRRDRDDHPCSHPESMERLPPLGNPPYASGHKR